MKNEQKRASTVLSIQSLRNRRSRPAVVATRCAEQDPLTQDGDVGRIDETVTAIAVDVGFLKNERIRDRVYSQDQPPHQDYVVDPQRGIRDGFEIAFDTMKNYRAFLIFDQGCARCGADLTVRRADEPELKGFVEFEIDLADHSDRNHDGRLSRRERDRTGGGVVILRGKSGTVLSFERRRARCREVAGSSEREIEARKANATLWPVRAAGDRYSGNEILSLDGLANEDRANKGEENEDKEKFFATSHHVPPIRSGENDMAATTKGFAQILWEFEAKVNEFWHGAKQAKNEVKKLLPKSLKTGIIPSCFPALVDISWIFPVRLLYATIFGSVLRVVIWFEKQFFCLVRNASLFYGKISEDPAVCLPR